MLFADFAERGLKVKIVQQDIHEDIVVQLNLMVSILSFACNLHKI